MRIAVTGSLGLNHSDWNRFSSLTTRERLNASRASEAVRKSPSQVSSMPNAARLNFRYHSLFSRLRKVNSLMRRACASSPRMT